MRRNLNEQLERMKSMMNVEEQLLKNTWNNLKQDASKLGGQIKTGVNKVAQKVADITQPEKPADATSKPAEKSRNLEQTRAEWSKINADMSDPRGFGEAVGQQMSSAQMAAQFNARVVLLKKSGKTQDQFSSEIVDQAVFELANGNYDHLVIIKRT